MKDFLNEWIKSADGMWRNMPLSSGPKQAGRVNRQIIYAQ